MRGLKFLFLFFCHDLNLAKHRGSLNQCNERVLLCSNLGGGLKGLLLLLNLHLGLGTHDTTTPLSAGLVVLLHEAILDGRDKLGKLVLILRADLGESEDGSGLVNQR